MKKVLITALAALAFAGCSTTSQPDAFQTFLRNLTAAQCADPAAAVAQIPLGFISQAQAVQAVTAVCSGLFGTVAAPTTAPGNLPTIPGAPASK